MARLRRTSALCCGGLWLFTLAACEKLIGIEDTPVAAGGSGAASPSASAGSSGAGAHAGAASAGRAAGGADDESAGASGSGTSGAAHGGATNGGAPNHAGASNAGAPSGGSATAGTSGASAVCDCKPPTPVCDGGTCIARGPTQVLAGSKAGGTEFYIDSTEVTNGQYAAFLAAKGGDTSGQRAACSWNDSYEPTAPIGDNPRPAVNVDFCDAAAFCDWAGERLCGDLNGGPLAITDLRDATKSQWYLACAGTDDEYYPYGNNNAQLADGCNEYNSGLMADVGSFSLCEGHYKGVFDLVGNAAEWVDACDDTGDEPLLDNCWLMGGSYLRDDYKCQSHDSWVRSDTAAVFGFRCCSK